MVKSFKHLIFSLIIILLLPITVLAKDSIELKVDKTDLKIGDEIIVSANVTNKLETYALMGTLKYDQKVFENIDDNSFTIKNNESIKYNKDSNKFGIINKTGKIVVDERDALFTVHLKVKDNANVGNTNIALTNITYTSGNETKTLPTTAIKILVTKDANDEEVIPANQENEIVADKENVIKTFSNMPIIIIISVLILINLIAIIYVKIKNQNAKEQNKSFYYLLVLEIILIILLTIILWFNISKRDVNKDGQKDYQDAEEIIDYLINIEGTKEKSKSSKNSQKYDVNNDGKVDLEDVGNTIEQIEKNTTVSLKEIENDEYYALKGNIIIKFTADINPSGVQITKIKVGNKYYDVQYNSGVYIAIIDNINDAGKHNFVIEEVKLSNGIERKTNLKIMKEVLKDIPKVEKLNYYVASDNLEFDIKDEDQALQKASITIFEGNVSETDLKEDNTLNNDDFDKYKIVFEQELDITNKSFTLNPKLALGGIYTIVISGTYDLDSDINDNKNHYQEEILKNGINTVTVGKVTITAQNKKEIFLNKNEQYEYLFDIDFEPKNIAQEIKQVLIGDEYRDVLYENGHVKLVLNDTLTHGAKTLNITAVKLADGTDVLCNHEIKYDVLKDAPTIENFVYHKKDGKITFTINDADKAIKDANIKITSKSNQKEVFKKELALDTNNYEFDVNLKDGDIYNVSIEGNYDLDSDINNGQNTDTESFEHEIIIYNVKLINANENEKYYTEKGAEVALKFKAQVTPTNDEAKISQVEIGDEIYEPEKSKDGTYTINIVAPTEAGEKIYKLKNIIFDNEELDKTLDLKVDVLKDAPTIENLLIDESKDIPKITFDLKDEESALIDKTGSLIIKNQNGDIKEYVVKSGSNAIELKEFAEDLEGGIFSLDIKANYNRSHNDNEYLENNKELIETKQFKIYKATLTLTPYNKYISKNSNTEFIINSSINPSVEKDVTIEYFILENGQKITAKKLKNSTYAININDLDEIKNLNTAGDKNYKITKIILSNNIEIKTSSTISFYILKDIPYINKLNLSEKYDFISYELADFDNAFIDGKIIIYDKNDKQVVEDTIKKEGTAKIKYNFIDGENYTIKVIGSYDLDSEPNNNQNEVNNKEMSSELFLIGGEYNFTLTNASITDTIKLNEKPIITFKSTNTRNTTINKVNLKDDNNNIKQYNVIETDKNNYQIVLTDADTSLGKHTITLDSVIMTNDAKTFENQKDYNTNKLTYTVLKEAPSIKDLKLDINKTNKTISANFILNDINNAIKKLNIVLVDSTGKIISNKELTEGFDSNNTINVELSYNNNTDGRYTVRILADYELADKYIYTNENIGEDTTLVYTDEEVRIEKIYVVNNNNEEQITGLYPTKNQKNYQIAVDVYVADSVKARGYSRVSGVTINGVNYPASQINGYKSKVFINVPKEAGIIELKATRVQLANDGYYRIYNDYYSVNEKTLKLDVLKDIPKIEDLKIEENYAKKEVKFNFKVVLDKTAKSGEFTDGVITLNNDEHDIFEGDNSIVFKNVTPDQTFDLTFKGTYDLDTNELNDITNEKNNIKNGTIYSVKYGLYNANIYDNIAIDEAQLISENGNKYFEKNEAIKVKLKISGIDEKLELLPNKVVIADKEYLLTPIDNSYYELTLDGYSNSGEKNIIITDIILNNNKKINLKNKYTIKPEILKDIPKIDNYKYKVTDDNINLTIDLKDSDAAIVKYANLKITDEKGNVLYNDKFNKEVDIKRTDKEILRYYVQLTAEYDRDIDKGLNTENHINNVLLLDELISLEENNIEFKDITDINVYKKEVKNGEEVISLKDKIDVKDISANKNDYFVEIVMENYPNAYAEIKNILDNDNTLTLVLKYDYVIKENSQKEQIINIDFGTITNGIANNEFHPSDAFKSLIAKLEKGENVKLEHDYDASSYLTEGATYILSDYNGTLDGNGYTIKHLTKPLFNKITGNIQNLKITDVVLGSADHGALANTAYNAKISNVLIDKVTKTNNDGKGNNGGLVGLADNTEIVTTRVTNVLLNLGWLEQGNGIFIGHTQNNTSVTNCYAEGILAGGWNYTSGFIGNAQRTTITNNYLKVTARGQTEGATAFGNAYGDQNSVYKNNICIATGTNGNFASSFKSLDNNYFFQTNGAGKEVTGVSVIDKESINNDLFVKAQFDNNIWKIKDDVSMDNLPIFQIENVSVLNELPSVGYKEENEILYSNLIKLMPYYDSNKIVETSEKIPENNDLRIKTIKHIVPIDANGSIVNYLTTNNPKKIIKLKVVFTDGTKTEYSVIYNKIYDMVATYKINELNIDYNYEHYVIDSSSQVIVNLTNYLKNLDYTNNLDILTTNDDSRLYKDFYNENTKNDLEEFVLKYLSNSNYTNTTANEIINNYIEREVKKDKKIEKVLYTYNYFKRFFDLDIDGMKVYDFIMFNMQGFDESLTPDKIANLYLQKTTGENFNTNRTSTSYNEVLGNYTKLNTIPKFIEYLVSKFSNNDLSKWTRSQFKGIIEEIPLKQAPNVKYTLWDHFISESNDEILNQFLPMLTLPENAAYIISMPVQYIIGAQRTYIKDPTNPQELADLKKRISTYTVRMERYFDTAYSILQDEKLFNNILIYHIDKRTTKDLNGASVFNTVYTTTEPFHKNFVEATGLWAAAAGVNAAAWGPRLEWQVAGVLDSTLSEEGYNDTSHVTFRTWSHESAHLIDARLFLRNNGRRFDAGGEDYADNFLMQSFGINDITMNLSMILNKDSNKVASNLTPSRINSASKIQDFYKKLFETVYVMDYIEAQAFLRLPDNVQKNLAIQVSYPNEDKQFAKVVGPDGKDTDQYEGLTYKEDIYAKYRARETTKYTRLNELPDFDKPLKTMSDLIDNRIMLYPGVYRYSSRGNNSYGGEGINTVHWYQPNNPDGRPDSYALKWISYEMLGYKGYDNGFVAYASNINSIQQEIYKELAHPNKGTSVVNYKTDKMALMQITNNEFSDFSDYKKYRFNDIKNRLVYLDSEINVDEYINKFVEALELDAKDITEGVQDELNKKADCATDYWCSRGKFATYLSYQYSTKVRQEIYYTLKNKTNDFVDDIFKDVPQQTINNLVD